jgi:hypothetical protein
MFITVVPVTKLFAWGKGDSGGHASTPAVYDDPPARPVCVFITAVPGQCVTVRQFPSHTSLLLHLHLCQ